MLKRTKHIHYDLMLFYIIQGESKKLCHYVYATKYKLVVINNIFIVNCYILY